MEQTPFNNRILICDDNRSIHEDLLKILKPQVSGVDFEAMRSIESQLFEGEDDDETSISAVRYPLDLQIDHAFNGMEALEMVSKAKEDGNPYAVVFMDVRMPPGIDGVVTIKHLWEMLPNTEVVIVTAFSDLSWDEIIDRLGANDKLLYLRKPFHSATIKQLALNLTHRWNSVAKLRERLHQLEGKQPGLESTTLTT